MIMKFVPDITLGHGDGGVGRSCCLSFLAVIKNQTNIHSFIYLFDIYFCISTMWQDSSPQHSGMW